MIIIVTRHPGAVRWLREKGYEGVVVAHLTPDQITQGNIYIGSLPLPMISIILDKGSRFFLLNLPEIAFSQRGQDMTPEEMDRAGALLVEVKSIVLEPVELPAAVTQKEDPKNVQQTMK